MPLLYNNVLEVLSLVSVQRNKDEQHRSESPHRGASVAHEWKWDTDHRHESDGHADVDEQVHEYAA